MAEKKKTARRAGFRHSAGSRLQHLLESAWLDGRGRWARPAEGMNYAMRARLLAFWLYLDGTARKDSQTGRPADPA